MGVPVYSPEVGGEMEDVLDRLYAERGRALDPECSTNIRNEAWTAIDGLLDVYNLIVADSGT